MADKGPGPQPGGAQGPLDEVAIYGLRMDDELMDQLMAHMLGQRLDQQEAAAPPALPVPVMALDMPIGNPRGGDRGAEVDGMDAESTESETTFEDARDASSEELFEDAQDSFSEEHLEGGQVDPDHQDGAGADNADDGDHHHPQPQPQHHQDGAQADDDDDGDDDDDIDAEVDADDDDDDDEDDEDDFAPAGGRDDFLEFEEYAYRDIPPAPIDPEVQQGEAQQWAAGGQFNANVQESTFRVGDQLYEVVHERKKRTQATKHGTVESILTQGYFTSVFYVQMTKGPLPLPRYIAKVMSSANMKDVRSVIKARKQLLLCSDVGGRGAHPFIAEFHDLKSIQGFYVSIREFVDGTSLGILLNLRKRIIVPLIELRDRLAAAGRQGPDLPMVPLRPYIFDLHHVKLMLGMLASGVNFLHRIGIAHRDICPSNVILTDDGYVKIIDFGDSVTKPLNGVAGTPEYMDFMLRGVTDRRDVGTDPFMAPDMMHFPYGAAADWWSLGALAIHLLLGPLTEWDLPQLYFRPDLVQAKLDREAPPAIMHAGLENIVACWMHPIPAIRAEHARMFREYRYFAGINFFSLEAKCFPRDHLLNFAAYNRRAEDLKRHMATFERDPAAPAPAQNVRPYAPPPPANPRKCNLQTYIKKYLRKSPTDGALVNFYTCDRREKRLFD